MRIMLRLAPVAAAALLCPLLCVWIDRAEAAGEQAEQFTPEFRQIHTAQDPKHTPKITAPDSVKRGECGRGGGAGASSVHVQEGVQVEDREGELLERLRPEELDGQFTFPNLPAGQYQLHVWHERLGMSRATVVVRDQQPGRVTVEMKAS